MGLRIIDHDAPASPHGRCRVTIPLDTVQQERRESLAVSTAESERAEYESGVGPIGGVDLGNNPLGILSADQLPVFHQAVKSHWTIPTEALQELGPVMWRIARDAEDARTKINAGRVLVAMVKNNTDADRKSEPQVNVNVTLNPEALKQLSLEDIERRIAELEASGGGG